MNGHPRFGPGPRAAAVVVTGLLCVTGGAQDLPTGGTSDCATFTPGGTVLQVSQMTPHCVIDWASFDIGVGFTVAFDQQGTWRVLNRVGGDQFSTIAGTLSADGTVYITNPAGIYFANGAVVDVGGIYAAAGSMTDEDFLGGVDRFIALGGDVVNETALLGEVVHLIGRRVVNDGTISTGGGAVTMLAADNEVLLSEAGGRIMVRIDGVDLDPELGVSPGGVPPTLTGPAGVENAGAISAAAGQVVLGAGDLYSLAIRNTGTISAPGGETQLAALGGTVLQEGASLVADDLSLTGDVLFLDGDLNANNARLNDPVVVGSNVQIEGETTGTGAAGVVFASTVDSQIGENNDLDIDAAQATLVGDVGSSRRLGRLDLSDQAEIAGDVRTEGDLAFGGDTTFTGAGNQVMDSDEGMLSSRAALTKTETGNLTLTGEAMVDLDGDVAVIGDEGNLVINGGFVDAVGNLSSANGRVTINGPSRVEGTVSAGLDARFNADTEVIGTVSAGLDAEFFADATVTGSVTAGDDVVFLGEADLTGDVAAVGGDVDFAGPAVITGTVSAGEDVAFLMDATIQGTVSADQDIDFLGADTMITGTVSAGEDAEFAGPAVIFGSVAAVEDIEFFDRASVFGTLSAGEDVEFNGPDTTVAGSISAGDDVVFAGPGTAVFGDVSTDFGDVEFVGPDTSVIGDVSAGDDVEFIGSNTTVVGTVASGDDVEVCGAGTTLIGDVVAGDDVEVEAAVTISGDVTAVDDVRLNGALVLDGDDQRVEAADVLRATAAIDKTTPGALTLVAGSTLVLNGTLVRALDDLRLNPAGRTGVPDTATMTANRDLAIVSRDGDVVMGPNEKLTVLGTLTIDAAKRVTAGDLNTLGDMIITAQEIVLRTRAAGLVRDASGALVGDAGLDFTAGGRFLFSVAPFIEGGGPMPRFGSALLGGDGLGTLSDFRVMVLFPFGAELFRFKGTFLDLIALGGTTDELAEALGGSPRRPDPGAVAEAVVLSPTESAETPELGIGVRPLRPDETRGALVGRYLYNDALSQWGQVRLGRDVAVNRLSRVAVMEARRRFESFFVKELRDETTGESVREDRTPEVRASLAADWQAYVAAVDTPDGVGFRRFLESEPGRQASLGALEALREVLAWIHVSGLSAAELATSRRSVLDPCTPDGMSRRQFEQAVEGP